MTCILNPENMSFKNVIPEILERDGTPGRFKGKISDFFAFHVPAL